MKKQNSKLSRYICATMYLKNFNKEYEYILEKEMEEIDMFLSNVSERPSLIYDYVSTNVKGTIHKWC
jgi:hypothetical protein